MKKWFSLILALALSCMMLTAGAEIALEDGVYAGEGSGFNLTVKVPVEVEIKDGKMVNIPTPLMMPLAAMKYTLSFA